MPGRLSLLISGLLLVVAGPGATVHVLAMTTRRGGQIAKHHQCVGSDRSIGPVPHEMLQARRTDPDATKIITLVDSLGLAADRAEGEPQDNADASYAGWMEPDFMFVDWSHGALEIHNQVRTFRFGLFGHRGPFTRIDGRWMTLLRTELIPADGVKMICGDGPIWITDMIPAVPPDR